MKLRPLLAVLCLTLALTACPKKKSEDSTSSEPVEGSSSANNEKATEAPNEEMQEKKGDAATDPAPNPADPAAAPEEKK